MAIRRVLLAILAVVAFALPATAHGQGHPVVFSGTVTWTPATPIGTNVRLLVRVVEVSGGGQHPYTGVIEARGAITQPYQFSLTVPSSWFKPHRAYALEVFVADGDAIRYKGSIPVTSAGALNLAVTANPATGSLSKTSEGLLLAIGLSLAIIAAGLFIWRQMRLRGPVRQFA